MQGTNLGTIWSEIGVDYSKYDQAVNHVVRQNSWLDAETQKSMSQIGRHYDQLGKQMSIALTAPLVLIGRQWFNTFADFEQSMANVRAIVGGTAEEMEMLGSAARRAGEDTIYTASAASNALYYLGQAGMDANQAIGALDGTLALAAATQSDLAYTSNTVAASLAQFKLEAEDSTRVANLFAAANANSLANIEKLTDSMRYAGPVAAGFGMSIEETTAILMKMYDAGLQGSQAGTTFRMAIQSLAAPTGAAVDVLRDLKLSVQDVHPEFNEFSDILDTLNERGITTTQTMQLFGSRAGSGMSVLLQSGGAAVRQLTQDITGTDEAARQAQEQIDNLAGDIKILKSVYESLSLTMTGNFEPALRSVVQGITDMFRWMEELSPSTQRFLVILAGAGAAGGPMLLLFNQLLRIMPLLFSPAGAVYAGIAAVTALGFAMAGSERDMMAFYETTLDTATAARTQAQELRGLINEYNYLEGKPEKSKEEHRRLELVMDAIVKIQPDLVRGYKDIDEALRDNIGTLDIYIERLQLQSETQIKQAQLEFIMRKNALEEELSLLQLRRDALEEDVPFLQTDAETLALLVAEYENLLIELELALEEGADSVVLTLEQRMKEIVHAVNPEWDIGRDEFGKWLFLLQKEITNLAGSSGKAVKELEDVRSKIFEIEEELTQGEFLLNIDFGEFWAETEKVIEATEEVPTVIEKTVASVGQDAIENQMILYRAQIALVKNAMGDMADEYVRGYGSLEDIHERYIEFLNDHAYNPALSLTEDFRAGLATELGKIREDLEGLTTEDPEITKDINTVVTSLMSVYEAELAMLRMGITEFIEEFGSLESHLETYSNWLAEQVSDTALETTTRRRLAEARVIVEDELDQIAEKARFTQASIEAAVAQIVESYGPMADRMKQALDLGEVTLEIVTPKDIEEAKRSMQGFYDYLVDIGEIPLDKHLEVVTHQIELAQSGTSEWIRLQQELARGYDKTFSDALRLYNEEVRVAELSLTEQRDLYKQIMDERVAISARSAETQRAIQLQLLDFDRRIGEESLSLANKIADEEIQLEIERLNYIGRSREAEIAEADQHLAVRLAQAEGNYRLMQVARESHAISLLEIDRRYAAQEEDVQKQIEWMKEQVAIQRLQDDGRFQEAAIRNAQLSLDRQLYQYRDNLEMRILAREMHGIEVERINADFADKRRQEIAREVQDEIKERSDLYKADLDMLMQWIEDRRQVIESEDPNADAALGALVQFESAILQEIERRAEERQRAEERWNQFLVRSGQVAKQEYLQIEIDKAEEALQIAAKAGEDTLELERSLAQRRRELADQELEDRRTLLRVMVMEEELSLADQLDLLGRIRQDYEAHYGDLYHFSQEWQALRQEEIALEEKYSQEIARARAAEITVNTQSLRSLNEKKNKLIELIAETDVYIEQQEYLTELMETQEQMDKARSQSMQFFESMSPELRQLRQGIELIEESQMAFENLRYELNQMYGDLGTVMSGIIGGVASFSGAGGADAGLGAWVSGILGTIAGLTGDPVIGAIATGVSFITKLFDPGPMPQEMESLKTGIEDMNQALEEYGVAYRAVEADIRKTYFLIFATGWEFVNEDAARAGFEAGQAMLESMNTSLQQMGSVMAQAVSGHADWDDLEAVLGQQFKRILMESVLVAVEFQEQAKILVGMMHELIAEGVTEEGVDLIRERMRRMIEEANEVWEELGGLLLGDLFPEDDTTVHHEVRGVQITRLSGEDRELFVEFYRSITGVFEQLVSLFMNPVLEVYQDYQMATIETMTAQEILIQQVLIQQVHVNIGGVTNVRRFVEDLVAEALSSVDGMGRSGV